MGFFKYSASKDMQQSEKAILFLLVNLEASLNCFALIRASTSLRICERELSAWILSAYLLSLF